MRDDVMDGASASSNEPGFCNAKRRVDDAGPVQRSATVGSGRCDIYGASVNALVGSFPFLNISCPIMPFRLRTNQILLLSKILSACSGAVFGGAS
jgi:hypothetical protein